MIPIKNNSWMSMHTTNPLEMNNVGVNEAPNLNPKMFINPDPNERGMGRIGGVGNSQGMPIGGIQPPQQVQQGQPQQGGLPQPQGMGQMQPPQGPQPPMGNMLNMTPQGRDMQNMQAQPQSRPMKKGGVVKHTHEIINSKNGKVVGKFGSLKDARVHHAGMKDHEEHEIQPVKKMAKSIDIMKVELLTKKGKR